MTILVFDIETIPDLEGGRHIYDLGDLPDKDAAHALFTLRRQENGSEFLRLHLQRVVAISCVLRQGQDKIAVWSLCDEQASEADIIQRFFELIERHSPTLVSWNGGGFDLPVLHYRAMRHRIQAPRYWDQGEHDREAKWNNYIGRYHQRHTDLMDLLAMYQGRAVVPLDQMAQLLGYPGKLGMSGAHVWEAFQQGELAGIRNYCETDVLNTYLIWLRFEHMRGHLDDVLLTAEEQRLRTYLAREERAHFNEFLDAWPVAPAAVV